MKRAAALITWLCFSGCTFPDYGIAPSSLVGGAGTAGASTDGTSGSAGTGNVAGSGAAAGDGPVTPAPTCKDEERNGTETGIDCGMVACSKQCPAGQGCDGDVDCQSGNCEAMVCRAASCSDTLTNGNETDQDCGGDQGCARCTVGQHCALVSDCDGGLCTNGQCAAPSCKDKLQNANETDTDCGGGTCSPCTAGSACNALTDCDGGLCTKKVCQAASCDDKLLNQDETDQDCGGSCSAACGDGLKCKVPADCTSGVCTPGTLTCAAPTCVDKVQNGNEPTTDCGGSCPTKCKLLDACRVGADCSTTSCVDQRCLPPKALNTVLSPAKWTATAQVTQGNSTPMSAIDGSQSTYWISGTDQTPKMWFKLDMASEQVVFSLVLDCNSFEGETDMGKTDIAQAIDIVFAEDEKSLDTATPIIQNHVMTSLHETIVLPKPQVGRWMRIALSQGKNRWWRMDEVQLRQ